MKTMRVCAMHGCESFAPYKAKMLCAKHYLRLRNSGQTKDPTFREWFWGNVPVRNPGDCWEWNGSLRDDGYGQIRISGTLERAHRVSYSMFRGAIPDWGKIDHRCFNPPCVNPLHLRLTTNKQNMENRSGLDSNNTSGSRGVSWDRTCNKWVARVAHNGKTTIAGYYSDLEEAAESARGLRLLLFTHNDLDRIPS